MSSNLFLKFKKIANSLPLGGAQRRDIRLLADIQPGLHSDREVRGRQQVSHKPPEHKSQDSFNFHCVGARVSSVEFFYFC